MTPPRESWTDERLDDLKEHMDEGFRDLKAELRQHRDQMTQLSRQKDIEARFGDLTRTIHIVFTILGAVLTANTALLVAILGWIATHG